MTVFHSTFTPSESDPEILEKIFVARESLATDVLEGIRQSATSGNKLQRLLVGPRGIGKTHFVSLIYHRVCEDAVSKERLLIAWLREDPYVADYAGLLLEILKALGSECDLQDVQTKIDEVLDLADPQKRERRLEEVLATIIGDKTLLLIVENLDELLLSLRDEGQKKLRALINNTRKITTLATTTSLIDAIADRNKAFFGFFRQTPLNPLSVEEAVNLLAKLATLYGDPELAEAISTPMGLARIRAVHYLAGGSPRIYVLFFDFLGRESLDSLVKPFLKLIDDLTPYYQARMSMLAPLQRLIIDILRRFRGAATVTEIAREAMNTPQSISTQLGKLRELGYVVQAASVGRSNYYELREPLMRLCLEVKEQRGRTVELFVAFLRVWYSGEELEQLATSTNDQREYPYLKEALKRAGSETDPVLGDLRDEFYTQQAGGDFEKALEISNVAILRTPKDKESWRNKAQCLEKLDRDPNDMLACWRKVAELDPRDAIAWTKQGILLTQMGRFEEAEIAARKALELSPEDPVLNRNYSLACRSLGLEDEARTYLEKAIRYSKEPNTASDWYWRGHDLGLLRREKEALEAFRTSLLIDPRQERVWGSILAMLQDHGKTKTWARVADRLVKLMPDKAQFHAYQGTAFFDLNQVDHAIKAYHKAIELDPDLENKGHHVRIFLARLRAFTHGLEEGIASLTRDRPREPGQLQLEYDLWITIFRMLQGNSASVVNSFGRIRKKLGTLETMDLIAKIAHAPLVFKVNASITQRFLEIFLDAFKERSLLLGQGLIYSLTRIVKLQIDTQAAREWVALWKVVAADIEELELPLRLLETGVVYYESRDQVAIVRLPAEERGLLEPWFFNLFEDQDEIDQELDHLLDETEAKLRKDEAAKQQHAFWTQPRLDLADSDIERTLTGYGEVSRVPAKRLLAGAWRSLNHAQAKAFLNRAVQADDKISLALSRKGIEIQKIRRRSLSFSQWSLIHIDIRENDAGGALDLLVHHGDMILLEGISPAIYAMVDDGRITLDTSEKQLEYLCFFCSAMRNEESRFAPVNRLSDLDLKKNKALENALIPWGRQKKNKKHLYHGSLTYSGDLFNAWFDLDPKTGMVDMTDIKPVADGFWKERFDGPLRFMVPSTSEPKLLETSKEG